jgi:hypothetical protein
MIAVNAMTQQDIELLLQESAEISSDWEAYLQFCRKREANLKRVLAIETSN